MIFMMNFIKFHMMAINYKNAALLDDPIKSEKLLTSRERHHAEYLRERVNFTEFVHYFMFCGAAWTGMSHEYRWWSDFMNKRGAYEKIPKSKLFVPAIVRFSQMLVCLVMNIIIGSFFPLSHILTEDWANSPILYRATYFVLAGNIKFFMYFIGFGAMEANFIACG